MLLSTLVENCHKYQMVVKVMYIICNCFDKTASHICTESRTDRVNCSQQYFTECLIETYPPYRNLSLPA